jgi:hypothetical protein
VPVASQHNKGVLYRRVTFHCGRYLSWLNPEAAKLNLIIGSSDEFKPAVDMPPDQVPGPV